jgi:hypothetical protein
MNARLEALRILVAAGIVPVQGVSWNEGILDQSSRTIIQLASQVQKEMQPPPPQKESE